MLKLFAYRPGEYPGTGEWGIRLPGRKRRGRTTESTRSGAHVDGTPLPAPPQSPIKEVKMTKDRIGPLRAPRKQAPRQPLPGMPDPDEWLTLREVSNEHDIPYQTLYAAVTSGRLPRATPVGTRILVRPADAAAYVKLYRKYQSAQLRTEIK